MEPLTEIRTPLLSHAFDLGCGPLTLQDHLDTPDAGEVLVCMGQVTDASKRQLDRLVKRGYLLKWRGHWHPVAGAPYGIGPLKTCYATPATAEARRAA